MELTHEEIMQLMVNILGGSVDDAAGWTSSGPSSSRNNLLTTERVITRALNDIDQRMLNILSTVDGFAQRFDLVIGKNYTDDQITFGEIGSNLIVAVNDIKNSIINLTEEDIPNISINKVTNLQDTLDGKVNNSRVLTDVPVNAVFTDTVYVHPDNHPVSLITGLQGILDTKVDNSRVLTDVPVNAVFTDTVYEHPNTDGSKHIPAGSKPGQVLACIDQPETAVWTDIPGSVVDPPETITNISLDVVLTSANWVVDDVNGGYKYIIADNNATAESIADVYIGVADLDKAASIKSANETVEDQIILFATEAPVDDIHCDIKITRPYSVPDPAV